jgi:hypothetical protein
MENKLILDIDAARTDIDPHAEVQAIVVIDVQDTVGT